MKSYRWAIIGAGTIAHEMAQALLRETGEIYGVWNHHPEKAQAFAAKYGVQRVFESQDALLHDPKIDIVYIATPHSCHFETILHALRAGKHVLCEKAITVNLSQLNEAADLAAQQNLILMEGMTLYHMPLYQKLKDLISSGVLGKIKMIQVNFGSCKEFDPAGRFFNKDLAGGALLDIGTYAVSFARFFMDRCPDAVLTTPQFTETGVDEQSGILLKNSSGQMAVISLSMCAKQPKRGVVAGESGYIEVHEYPRANTATIFHTATGSAETITAGASGDALRYEIKHMHEAVASGNGVHDLPLSRDVMQILTAVRSQWGMRYPFE